MSELPQVANDCLINLGHLLESLPVDESQRTVTDNLVLLNQIASKHYFGQLLGYIVGESDLLAQIASRSYRHVNYFDKIVLVGSDKLRGYRLTLHLWCPPYTDKELKKESLHDHRFNFWSVILTGTLRSENFVEATEGVLMQHYRYIPEKRTEDVTNFYEYVGDKRILRSELLERSAEESYYQSSFGIHRVLLPERLTCTLVLRGPRQKAFTNTYRTDIPKMNRAIANEMFTETVVKQKLLALLNAID
jgi:hypothetical protein